MTSLVSIPALRRLAPHVLDELSRDSTAVRFDAGAVVRRAGEPACNVVLLLSGTVVATHASPSGLELWPDRWVGPAIADKPAVLHGGAPPTGLSAITASAARLLPRARFLRLLEDEPSVRVHVLGQLSRDVMAAQQWLARAVTLPAVAQVAAWLNAQHPADPVAWRGSQEQLAHLLGLSRVTVNRALGRLSERGAIRVTACGIVVADRQRLRSLSLGG